MKTRKKGHISKLLFLHLIPCILFGENLPSASICEIAQDWANEHSWGKIDSGKEYYGANQNISAWVFTAYRKSGTVPDSGTIMRRVQAYRTLRLEAENNLEKCIASNDKLGIRHAEELIESYWVAMLNAEEFATIIVTLKPCPHVAMAYCGLSPDYISISDARDKAKEDLTCQSPRMKKFYFVDPINIFAEFEYGEASTFINLLFLERESFSSLQGFYNDEDKNDLNDQNQVSYKTLSTVEKIISEVPAYISYPHPEGVPVGSCGQISMAMVLGYWDDRGYNNLIDGGGSSYPGCWGADGSGWKGLVWELGDVIGHGGSYEWHYHTAITTVCNSITYNNNYEFQSVYSGTYSNASLDWSAFCAEIDAGRPIVYQFRATVTVNENGVPVTFYTEHVVAGIGYKTTGSSSTEKWRIVHYNSGLVDDPCYMCEADIIGTTTITTVIPGGGHWAGTYNKITMWSGNVSVDNNIVFNTEANPNLSMGLTILPGTAIKFSGYYTLYVNSGAKILAEGTSAAPIIFTSASGSLENQWRWIQLEGGNNVFKYCNCSYGQYSFFLNGCYSPGEGEPNRFEHCTFSNNSCYGIRFDNSAAELVACEIVDNNQIGVRAYLSTVDFTGNGIRRNNSRGVYTPGGSNLEFYGSVIEDNTQYGLEIRYVNNIYIGMCYGWYGYNTIRNNGNTEVYVWYSGSVLSTVDMNYSSIYDDTGLEVYNYPGNYQVSTQNCYWGEDNVWNNSGNVWVQGPVYYPPVPDWDGDTTSTGSPLDKASSPEIDTDKFLIDPTLPQEDQVKQCKALIASGTDKKEATEALGILFGILRSDFIKNQLDEKDSFRDYLNSYWTSHSDKAVGKRALQYLIIWDILSGDDDQAIDLSKKALKVLEKEEANCVMYDLAYAYLRKGWTENAKECLKSLKKQWDSEENAIWQLEEDIAYTEEQIAKGLIQPDESLPPKSAEELPKEAALLQNYPNPGNPTTMIQYQLPEARRVVLKIYNILGEEIATLINRQEEAGIHQVVWNGKDRAGLPVSTGLYIYRLEAGERVFTKKLMLIK